MNNKLDPRKVKNGDLMAFVNYVTVTRKSGDSLELIVKDLDHSGKEIRVTGADLIENALSADQYAEEKKVTKTEAAEILISSHNRPFTVCFVKEKDDAERVLRGRLVKHEALLGRSMVEDLDITDGHKQRLVDHRTIKFLIVDNVRYIVK
jgi:hypothetical protein